MGDREKRLRCAGAIDYNLNHWATSVDFQANMKVFKNGQLLDCSNDINNLAAATPYMNRADAYIGKSNWNDAVFRGIIEDLKIYGTVLTAAKIQ